MDDQLLAKLCATFPVSAPAMIEQAKPLTEAQKDTLDRLPWTCTHLIVAVKVDGSRIVEVEEWAPGRNPITLLIEPNGRAKVVTLD